MGAPGGKHGPELSRRGVAAESDPGAQSHPDPEHPDSTDPIVCLSYDYIIMD